MTVRGVTALILLGMVGAACAQPPERAAPDPARSGRSPGAASTAPGDRGARQPGEPARGPGRQASPGAGEKADQEAGGTASPGAGGTAGDSSGTSGRTSGHKARREAGRVSGQKSGHGSVREGRPAHGADHKPAIRPLRSGPARALAEYSRRLQLAEARRFAAARRWGLAEAPLRAPAPPRIKPGLRTEPGLSVGSGLPPVITRVPTSDRVVFLTIDDGAEKDPRLTRMLRELRVPMSGFLSHYLVRMDYGYFRELSRLGAGMHNHTLNHLNLPLLSYRGQRREICGQQHHLREEFGELPRLFRPPFGNYNRDTLRAAASCGVRVIPLWSEEAFPDHMEFRVGDPRLHPGDIILTHFRGRAEWRATMPDLVRRVLNTATRQGFALARLEDYL